MCSPLQDIENNNFQSDHNFDSLDSYQEDPIPNPTFLTIDELGRKSKDGSKRGSVASEASDCGSLVDELESLGVRVEGCMELLNVQPADNAVAEAKVVGGAVTVTFVDYSKHYSPKISSATNYKRFLELVHNEDGSYPMTPDSGVSEAMELSEEERLKQVEEWQRELAKTEDEIMTLRQVIMSKTRQAQELKRRLGISAWKELTDDMSQGIQNIRETPAVKDMNVKLIEFQEMVTNTEIYQKTSAAVKSTAENTKSLLGGLGTSISAKFGAVKESGTFKTIEEKMGTAYSSVRTKISSRSNSTQSFDEALREAEAQQAQQQQQQQGQETTPTNPEPSTTS